MPSVQRVGHDHHRTKRAVRIAERLGSGSHIFRIDSTPFFSTHLQIRIEASRRRLPFSFLFSDNIAVTCNMKPTTDSPPRHWQPTPASSPLVHSPAFHTPFLSYPHARRRLESHRRPAFVCSRFWLFLPLSLSLVCIALSLLRTFLLSHLHSASPLTPTSQRHRNHRPSFLRIAILPLSAAPFFRYNSIATSLNRCKPPAPVECIIITIVLFSL